MKDILVVGGLILGGLLLSALAWPLLIIAGIGVGIAGLFGGSTAALVPAAFVAGALGVIGLVFRLAVGVFGVAFTVVLAVISALLPLLLLVLGGWWLMRGSRSGRRTVTTA